VCLLPRPFAPESHLVPSSEKLRAANGTEIDIEGRVTLPVTIQGQSFSTEFLVSPNVDDVILGKNWLAANSVTWNFSDNTIQLSEKAVQLTGSRHDSPRCQRCRISEDTVISPQSEAVLPTAVVYKHFRTLLSAEQCSTIPAEPVRGLRIARTLIPNDAPVAAVRVCNTTRWPIHLHKGQAVAALQKVDTLPAMDSPIDALDTAAVQRRQMATRIDPSVPAEHQAKLKELLDEYSDVFSYSEYDLGSTGAVQHRIDTGNNQPFRQPLRPQPRAYLPVIDNLIEEMQDQGVIEPSQSEWASNIVLVKKKDGTIRFCVDYRKLNILTTKDAYPLPRIESCLDTLSGSVWYSTFDLRSGFHQVSVHPRDVDKTTFVCHRGTYRFPRMPFGLCNAPATFQRLMDTVLAGLNFELCLVYLDDIIVFSRTLDEHISRLRKLFDRLRDANLKLKPTKCCLLQRRVAFLGYVVSEHGVETDPDKISAIRDWPTPTNLRQSRAFIGLCQYYRKFVPGFSEIAAPLHALTKKGVRFFWSTECQTAFERLKDALTTAPTLALPDEEGEFLLDCDASNFAIGAVLSQVQDGIEKPICYASQLYSRHEQNYNVTRKELLAIVTFVKKFRQYLLGRPFRIRTDHAALQWLKRTSEPIGQQARWLEILEEYNYSVVHRPGSQHGNADALSRRDERPLEAGVSAIQRQANETPPPADDSRTQPQNPRPIDWPSVQSADPDVRKIYDLAKSGSPAPTAETITSWSSDAKLLHAQYSRLSVSPQGVLQRRWEHNGREFQQVVVPSHLRQQIAAQLHRGLNGGHLGLRRARRQLQKRFYWPGWSRSVEQAQLQCDRCARFKKPQNPRSGQLQPMVVGEPWERLGIDVTGPHPASSRGNIYILTVVDHFTKWVEIFPMRNQEAATVAKLLVERVFCTHGCPLQILTDQGSNFESQLFQEICRRLSVDKIRTSPYKPSTNGNIERFHATMHSMIAKLVAENQRDWDDYLPTVAFAYRTSVNEATGTTPFYLTFGREARIPADICYGPPPDEPQEHNSYVPFVEQLQSRLRDAYHLVRQSLNRCAVRRQVTYNLKTKPTAYAVGSWVWCLVPRRRQHRYQKWSSLYQGPFRVTRIIGPVNVEIQRSTRTRPFIVHIDKLKLCHNHEAPKDNDNPTQPECSPSRNDDRPRRTIRRPSRFSD